MIYPSSKPCFRISDCFCCWSNKDEPSQVDRWIRPQCLRFSQFFVAHPARSPGIRRGNMWRNHRNPRNVLFTKTQSRVFYQRKYNYEESLVFCCDIGILCVRYWDHDDIKQLQTMSCAKRSVGNGGFCLQCLACSRRFSHLWCLPLVWSPSKASLWAALEAWLGVLVGLSCAALIILPVSFVCSGICAMVKAIIDFHLAGHCLHFLGAYGALVPLASLAYLCLFGCGWRFGARFTCVVRLGGRARISNYYYYIIINKCWRIWSLFLSIPAHVTSRLPVAASVIDSTTQESGW